MTFTQLHGKTGRTRGIIWRINECSYWNARFDVSCSGNALCTSSIRRHHYDAMTPLYYYSKYSEYLTTTRSSRIRLRGQMQQQRYQTSINANALSVVKAAERLLDNVYTEVSGRKRRRMKNASWIRRQKILTTAPERTIDSKKVHKAVITHDTKEKSRNKEEEVDDDDDTMFSNLPKAPDHDTRTVMDLIFPNPYKNEPPPPVQRIKWPKSLTEWFDRLRQAWDLYRWTWRGFRTSRGFLVEDEQDKTLSTETALSKTPNPTELIENLRRNAEFVKEEATTLGGKIQQTTGITTKDDLKLFVTDAMKLFSECVSEFMAGYRKGRDDEVEKMLTEYFQNLKEQANQPKRRKIKPRIRNRIRTIIRQRYLRTI